MSARGMTCYAVRLVVQMPGHPAVPLRMTVSRRSSAEAERAARRIATQSYRNSECREAVAVVDHDSVIHASPTDITPDDIRIIRASTATHKTIARRFGVPMSLVADIRAGRTWTSVP